MPEFNMKIVEFVEHCKKCKHKDVHGDEEPCSSCLEEPAREYSHKPVKFEEDG